MDYSLITVAAGALNAAKTLGQTLVGLHDFNQTAAVVSQLNGELLKAQDSLFTLSAQLHELQQENFRTSQELRDLKERMAERARYALHDIANGVFVYRSNGFTADGDREPVHYLCQPCFDKGTKAVLIGGMSPNRIETHSCPVCKVLYYKLGIARPM